MFCLRSSTLLFIGDKIAAGCFKYKNKPFLRTSDRLKFARYVALNHIRDEGGKPCKLSYKVLKKKYGYYNLIDILPHPKLIQLKYFLGGMHHCVIVLGKWIFDSNVYFVLPLTIENLKYCCINDDEPKGINVYKVVLKAIRLISEKNNKSVIHQ